jgi:hypothetical protein
LGSPHINSTNFEDGSFGHRGYEAVAMGTQPKKFAKPAVADVYGFLRRRDALIIHSSGPKGSEARPERLFPADLRNVIAGGAMGGLSCCVMGARDNFAHHLIERN